MDPAYRIPPEERRLCPVTFDVCSLKVFRPSHEFRSLLSRVSHQELQLSTSTLRKNTKLIALKERFKEDYETPIHELVEDIEGADLEVHKTVWSGVHTIEDGTHLYAENNLIFIVAPLPADPHASQPTVTWYANGTYEGKKEVLHWNVGSHFRLPPYSRLVVTGGSVKCIYGQFKIGEEGEAPADKEIRRLSWKDKSELTPLQKKKIREWKSRNWHREKAKKARHRLRREQVLDKAFTWTDEQYEEQEEREEEETAQWKEDMRKERHERRRRRNWEENYEFDDDSRFDLIAFKPQAAPQATGSEPVQTHNAQEREETPRMPLIPYRKIAVADLLN